MPKQSLFRKTVRAQLVNWKKFREDQHRKVQFTFKRLRREVAKPRRIDFVIAGAQKSGTTALDTYLREHPQIMMAEKKELHFFDVNRHFRWWPDYKLYHSFFNWSESPACYGEATPSYMYHTQALNRLFAYHPAIKIIIVLRNPVDRAFSHWNMERDRGYEHRSFFDAVDRELGLIANGGRLAEAKTSYLKRGLYHAQLEAMTALFPASNIHVIKYEDLRKEPDQQLSDVYRFLDVPTHALSKAREVHSRPYNQVLTHEERVRLFDIFEPDISNLERMLDWNCAEWRPDFADE